jgi:DNA-binding Lrp family transcriptional regulator
MVTAIILLNVQNHKINEVAQTLVQFDGVSEVYSVAGRVDLVAVVRCPGEEQIASLVTEKMLSAEGIISSETLIAFRAFSQHDLERMFSIGMD